jgi:PAS domain S-box-containing protein
MPFAFAASSLIVAWGLFRFSLLDIAPIARQHVVENMRDAVIVLDPSDRIIDINKAALRLIEKQRSEVIGRTPEIMLADWPSLVETVTDAFLEQKEVIAANEDKTLFLDIINSYIYGQKLEPIGRIVTIRDRTELETLKAEHQRLPKGEGKI